MTLTHPEPGFQGQRSFPSSLNSTRIALNIRTERTFLPERDYVTFRYLPSQIRLSVCRLFVLDVRVPYSRG